MTSTNTLGFSDDENKNDVVVALIDGFAYSLASLLRIYLFWNSYYLLVAIIIIIIISIMRFTTKLLPSRSGNLGVILLNNPKPFHALSLDMMHAFQDVIKAWYADNSMAAILVKSSKDTKKPAFCAGGDIKGIYDNLVTSKNDKDVHGQGVPGIPSSEFFRQEYLVDYALATAPSHIPQVSIWDGIVMGGGVGISIHGKYRVATENTLFAMPETGIGLFPDVGSMYWMPRMLSDGMAVYLALTGRRLTAPDLLYCGLATHYVPSTQLDELEAALITASQKLQPTATSENSIAPVLLSFHSMPSTDPQNSDLAKQKAIIEKVFGPALQNKNHGVEAICDDLAKLGDDDDDFGTKTLSTLEKMSPTSLKVTLEGLRRGAQQPTLGDDLVMEFRMAQHCMSGPDFREGVRAALVDKDGKPQWNPASLTDVTDDMVNAFFEPIQHEWEIPTSSSISKM